MNKIQFIISVIAIIAIIFIISNLNFEHATETGAATTTSLNTTETSLNKVLDNLLGNDVKLTKLNISDDLTVNGNVNVGKTSTIPEATITTGNITTGNITNGNITNANISNDLTVKGHDYKVLNKYLWNEYMGKTGINERKIEYIFDENATVSMFQVNGTSTSDMTTSKCLLFGYVDVASKKAVLSTNYFNIHMPYDKHAAFLYSIKSDTYGYNFICYSRDTVNKDKIGIFDNQYDFIMGKASFFGINGIYNIWGTGDTYDPSGHADYFLYRTKPNNKDAYFISDQYLSKNSFRSWTYFFKLTDIIMKLE